MSYDGLYLNFPNNNYNKTVIHIPTTLPIKKNIPKIIMADYTGACINSKYITEDARNIMKKIIGLGSIFEQSRYRAVSFRVVKHNSKEESREY